MASVRRKIEQTVFGLGRNVERAVPQEMYPNLNSLDPVGNRDRELELIRLLKEISNKLDKISPKE